MRCCVCDARVEGEKSLLCPPCSLAWETSPERKRALYFEKEKRPGPAATAFMDFIETRQKIRQNERSVAPASPAEKKKKT